MVLGSPRSRAFPCDSLGTARDPGRLPGNGLELPEIQGTSLQLAWSFLCVPRFPGKGFDLSEIQATFLGMAKCFPISMGASLGKAWSFL